MRKTPTIARSPASWRRSLRRAFPPTSSSSPKADFSGTLRYSRRQMTTKSVPSTLLGLFEHIPSQKPAIILPEANLHISYGSLREQVLAVAEQLADAGITRGDRVGIALPNGLPLIVSFLAASMAGTAAPLNPAYKEDEFRFFLEDTSAKLLILPPEGIDEA